MVIRLGRNGRILACSKYPDHKETRDIPGEGPELPAVEGAGEPCPKCKKGKLVARHSGDVFWGCSRYPKCDLTTSMEPLGALHDVDSGPAPSHCLGRSSPHLSRPVCSPSTEWRSSEQGFFALLLQLSLASLAAVLVYLMYSRLVRLPELPRTIGLLRAALQPR